MSAAKKLLLLIRNSRLRPEKLAQFVWWSSGADPRILMQVPQGARTLYTSLGVTVIITVLLEALAFAYFAYLFLSAPLWALVTGIVWGSAVFSLDRALLSMSGRLFSRLRAFLQSLPRLIMIIGTSIVLSITLSLGVFRKDVSAYLRDQRDTSVRETEGLLAARQSDITQLNRQLRDAESLAQVSFDAYVDEISGTGTSRTRGVGPVARLKKERYEQAQAELRRLRPELYNAIRTNQVEIAKLTERRQALLRQPVTVDILSQLGALKHLSNQHGIVLATQLLIFILLFLIDSAPFWMRLLRPDNIVDQITRLEEAAFTVNLSPAVSSATEKIDLALQSAFVEALDRSDLNPKQIGAAR
jgi:hypothetical protein